MDARRARMLFILESISHSPSQADHQVGRHESCDGCTRVSKPSGQSCFEALCPVYAQLLSQEIGDLFAQINRNDFSRPAGQLREVAQELVLRLSIMTDPTVINP